MCDVLNTHAVARPNSLGFEDDVTQGCQRCTKCKTRFTVLVGDSLDFHSTVSGGGGSRSSIGESGWTILNHFV